VRCAHESAGKKKGSGGKGAKKIGNAHLRWAFAEAHVPGSIHVEATDSFARL